MQHTSIRTPVVFACVAAATVGLAAAIAAQGKARTPGNIWPPAMKQMEKAVPLSPEDEMKTFSMPPGFRVELVASDPMIESPILMDFDPDGRLYVLEMLTFLPDTSGRDSREPLNRISVLEDTNGGGRWTRKRCSPTSCRCPVPSRCSTTASSWASRRTSGCSRTPTATSRPTPRIWSSAPMAIRTAGSSTTRTACSGRSTT